MSNDCREESAEPRKEKGQFRAAITVLFWHALGRHGNYAVAAKQGTFRVAVSDSPNHKIVTECNFTVYFGTLNRLLSIDKLCQEVTQSIRIGSFWQLIWRLCCHVHVLNFSFNSLWLTPIQEIQLLNNHNGLRNINGSYSVVPCSWKICFVWNVLMSSCLYLVAVFLTTNLLM